MITSLKIVWWTLKNRLRKNPRVFLFRLSIGLLFMAGMLLFVLWVSAKIHTVLLTIQALSPRLAISLTGRMLYALLLPLFPLMAISAAISTLGGLYNDPALLFYHHHPVTQIRHLALSGPRIILVATGYVILVAVPIFLQWGGFPLLASGFPPLLLYLLTASGFGMILTLLLTLLFPARLLNRLLGIALAVSGGLFVLSFRTLKPELFFSSPNRVATLLSTIPAPSPTPPGWTSALLAGAIFKDPAAKGLVPLLCVTVGVMLIMILLYATLYTVTWQRSGEVITREKGLTARIPEDSLFKALLAKEALSLLRDPTRFSQLALMAALLLLYLYNLTLIPGGGDPIFLHLIMTIHIALTGFILGALGVRFAFPSPSLDGDAAWFPAVHPVSPLLRETVRGLHYALWYLLLTLLLTGAIRIILPVPAGPLILAMLLLALLSFLLAMMAVGMGNIHPRYDIRNPLQIGFSPEGILYFALSLLLTAGTAWIYWRS